MNKSHLNSVVFFLETLGVGVWIGALVTFGFAVAAPVFRGLPSVTLAGSITAQVLHRINVLETVCAILMVLGTLVFLAQREQRTTIRILKAVIVGFMAGIFLYYGVTLMNRMEYLRTEEIKNFDQFEESTRAARDEFDRLHKRYSRLASANVWLGVGFLLLSGFERKGGVRNEGQGAEIARG
ncbi:MAG: DUF4149 domain-containing protein [Candidatus Binatia bacterium]